MPDLRHTIVLECENHFWISVTPEDYLSILLQIGKREIYCLDEIYSALKTQELIKN